MQFDDLLSQVLELLQREERVSYRSIKLRFGIDDDYMEGLKDELIYAKKLAADEDGRVLVWTGEADTTSTASSTSSISIPAASHTTEPEREPLSYTPAYLAEKILTAKSGLEGERKQVTVLFCDLQNSTPLAEKIGPENMHSLLNRFFELALSEVHRYEGTINQFLGDGFMALFGAPISHEDHARRGALAALALQRALKGADLGKPYGVECAFRMGLNSGLVVVGSIGDNLRMDYSAIGDTTNLASRLQQQAEPGDILINETTARLVQGYIRLEALVPVEVRGKTEPVSMYKVVGILPRRSPIATRSERTLSQFVGRERELATLEELFAQVEAGQGQVVGVVAEAGGGKSRLLYEFRQRLQDKRVTYLEGRCLSYGSSTPYHPIIDVVRNNCGITEGDSSETIAEKVRFAVQEVDMDPEDSVPYLLQFLGLKEGTESIAVLTPEAIRTRTFETLRQMSLSGAQRRPLLFEVEDLHWVDKTSEDYMEMLVESLAGASIMLLTSYRPGYQPSWIRKSYATQLSLHHLAPHEALTIVHSTTQAHALPDSLAQTIVAKAEGNPFFLEELTRAVIERGGLQAETTVPGTIHGVLMARIDRLPEEPKRLLQTASVLGREFSPTLLEAVWEGVGAPGPLLLELKRLEFLYERTGAAESTYVFKHALTQDVAYDSLLTNRRQTLHEAAGQALEALYAERLEDVHNQLAYHYARTANAAKAVAYLTLVAEKAAQGYAHAEAVASLQEALHHAERLSSAERDYGVLDLVVRQGEPLFWLGRHQELVDLFLGQQERLERLQEPLLAGRYCFWLGHAYSFLGQRELATQSFQRALEEGARCGDVMTIGKAHYGLQVEMMFAGPLHHSIAHGHQAASLLEATEERFWLGFSLYCQGLAHNITGDFQHALEVATRVHAIGQTIGDRRLLAVAVMTLGWSYTEQGAWEAGIEALQHAAAISPDAFETALFMGYLGYAYMGKGDLAQAIPILEQAVQEADRYRSRQVQSNFRIYLGEAYHLDDQIEKASGLAYQGLKLAEAIKFPWGMGRAQRILGCIALTNGNLAEAEFYLQHALETFASIHACFEQARTHLDCAALAHTQGHQDTATTHLSTAYAWFQKLQVPKWMERTEQRAREYGVMLTEVELEEFETEDSP